MVTVKSYKAGYAAKVWGSRAIYDSQPIFGAMLKLTLDDSNEKVQIGSILTDSGPENQHSCVHWQASGTVSNLPGKLLKPSIGGPVWGIDAACFNAWPQGQFYVVDRPGYWFTWDHQDESIYTWVCFDAVVDVGPVRIYCHDGSQKNWGVSSVRWWGVRKGEDPTYYYSADGRSTFTSTGAGSPTRMIQAWRHHIHEHVHEWAQKVMNSRWTNNSTFIQGSSSLITPQELRSKVYNFHYNVPWRSRLPIVDEWQLLHQSVSKLSRFTGNMTAYAADLRTAGDTIRALLRLVANPDSPQNWASAWLSLRYADRLTLSDTIELMNGIKEEMAMLANAPNPSRAGRAVVTHQGFTISSIPYMCTDRARIVIRDQDANELQQAAQWMYRWDCVPTLQNLWDLVPYSFIVDWFLNVSSILEQIDTMVETQVSNVVLWERSTKIILDIADFVGVSGTLDYISYSRRYPALPEAQPLSGWSPTTLQPVNLVDGVALIALR